MKIALEADLVHVGSEVARGRTNFTVVNKVPYGTGHEFLLTDPRGRTRWVTGECMEVHYKRTGNTTYTPAGGRRG